MNDTTDYLPFKAELQTLLAGRAPFTPLSELEYLSYWNACDDLELAQVVQGIQNAAKLGGDWRPSAIDVREFALAARPFAPLKVLPEWTGRNATPEQEAAESARVQAFIKQITKKRLNVRDRGPHLSLEAARVGLAACERNEKQARADEDFARRRLLKEPPGPRATELYVNLTRHRSDIAHWRSSGEWHRQQLEQNERKGA
jgi:hypothetical protein